MFLSIKKRDGRVAAFDEAKITRAIWNAGIATGEFGESEALELKDKVIAQALNEIQETIPGVEQIQDIVEKPCWTRITKKPPRLTSCTATSTSACARSPTN